jgi:hypothetical protein
VSDGKRAEKWNIESGSLGPAMGDKPAMSGVKVKKGAVVSY